MTPAASILGAVLLFFVGLYALGVLWFWRGLNRHQRPDPAHAPKVSVVVAARNEAQRLEGLLDDLQGQQYAGAFDVLLIDDHSSDDTLLKMRARAAQWPALQVIAVAQEAPQSTGKKAALSLGIARSHGDIILTTDADCRLSPDWVKGMVSCFGPEVGMVVGFSQIGRPGALQGLRQQWEAVDFLGLMAGARGSLGHGVAMAASGQSLGFRRLAFEQVGGYGPVMHRASGDDVLLLQLIRRGTDWEVAFCTEPQAFAVHPPAPSWGSLLQQRARWASNGPYQVFLSPFFFAYLLTTFGMSLMLAVSPVLVAMALLPPGWVGAAWLLKVATERLLLGRAMGLFGRRDLRRIFWLWSVSQPFYLLLVGCMGVLGRFEWKGKAHRWGRSI